jgi:nucleotide-binding universal stress UspA family protein
MIKDIVVNLPISPARESVSDFAISVASTLSAHVAGVAFSYEPVIPASVMGGIPSDLIEAQRRENEAAAKAAMARFEQAAKRAGVSAESRTLSSSVAGAADTFSQIARRFDISVIGQAERDKGLPEELIIEGTLFGSGRPTIVVPYIERDGLKLDRVTVCWDGSRAATRAIADSIPILERAKSIDVLIVASEASKSGDVPGADMGHHLARHNLKVDVKRITAPDIDVPSAILSYAADNGTDMLVMGGYGHSRVREFILGGATRGILSSMTVPVLMSH